LIINRIPIRNAGALMGRVQNNIYHWDESRIIFINRSMMYDNPARVKAMPPTISRFQDSNRIINSSNTGILCINRPNSICPKLNPGAITSKENNAKKQINTMDRIRGVQYINLFIFFINAR